MNARGWPLLLVLIAGQQPDDDLLLQIRTATTAIELGVAFEITVVRAWSTSLEPEPWQDRALEPLALQRIDTQQRLDGQRVQETLRFRARAFEVGELVIPAPAFRATARADGSLRATFGDELRLTVRSALPAEPGPPELPRDVFPAPERRLWWLGLGAVVVAAALAFTGYVRRSRRGTLAAPEETPHERALRRLRALRERAPPTRDDVHADAVEASALLRDYLRDGCGIDANAATTEELAPRLPAAHREALIAVLQDCDLTKFARRAPTTAERTQRLAAIEQWLTDVTA